MMQKLRSVLLLGVVVLSMFAFIGSMLVRAEAQPLGAGTHIIWATYRYAYIYDDHDGGTAGGGEWYFNMYADGSWVGRVDKFRDGPGYADFTDRTKNWYFSGSTSFRCYAAEEDGWPYTYPDLDSISYRDVSISWPWPTTNVWHYGSGLGTGGKGWNDVRHYYKIYINNYAPTVSPISGPTSGKAPKTFTYTASGSDPEGDSISYEWDVDGVVQPSTGSSMTYTFTAAGTYTVGVRTKDVFGRYSGRRTLEVYITQIIIIKKTTVTDLYFVPNPANPGQTVILLGSLKTITGTPVSGASINIEYGSTTLWTLTTNSLGIFSQTFTAPGVGNYIVEASFAGSISYYPSSDTDTLVVQSAGPKDTKISFSFSPNPANPGQTVTLLGTLKDVGGNPVYPAQVRVYYSLNGGVSWNYIWTLTTNAAGQFSRTFSAPGSGTYLVGVAYLGSAAYNPSTDTENLYVT